MVMKRFNIHWEVWCPHFMNRMAVGRYQPHFKPALCQLNYCWCSLMLSVVIINQNHLFTRSYLERLPWQHIPCWVRQFTTLNMFNIRHTTRCYHHNIRVEGFDHLMICKLLPMDINPQPHYLTAQPINNADQVFTHLAFCSKANLSS